MLKKSLIYPLTLTLLIGCSPNEPPKPPKEPTKVIRISLSDDVTTLDPRHSRNLISNTAVRMLYEGLMSVNNDGKLALRLAEKVDVSPDQKTYTFTLRDAKWSNGDPVTSYDFAYSWKTTLDPKFVAPNAYQLFDLLHAKEIKEGKTTIDDLGVSCPDSKTLVVKLEKEVPYFLELTAFHAFFPIHQKWHEDHPNENFDSPKDVPVNGPFILEKWARNYVFSVQKNPQYWDKDSVKIDEIIGMILEPNTAFQMYLRKAIDWTGSPLSILPPDAVHTLKVEKKLKVAAAAGTHFFRLNVKKAPFDNLNMRKAFALALNRQALTDHILQGGQMPAMSIIPPSLKLNNPAHFEDNQVVLAREVFQKALDEAGITKEALPPISLSYKTDERSQKIAQAVQQQWQKAFNIPILLDGCESKCYFEKVNNMNFQIASGSWFADFRDPINFLDVFKFENSGTNHTGWEDPEYIVLLDKSSTESAKEKRDELLREAENLLIEKMPVIPLFFYTFNYVKEDRLEDVYVSDLGYLDFSHAKLKTLSEMMENK